MSSNKTIGAGSSADRRLGWLAAFIVISGSVLFLLGGRAHPAINAAIGASPEEFFRAFAEKVRHTHGWHSMHMLILIGPLFWAVGGPGVLDALRPEARTRISMARSALLISAALWGAAFVIDGFGAPVYAHAIAAAPSPDASRVLLTSFEADAVMMSRFGLVGWIAGGLGIVGLAALLVSSGTRGVWRVIVGASGILIGLWPLAAALQGEYAGGPFVSRFWMANALLVGLWYIALATCAFRGAPVKL